jgi:FkbM family methyltransferase
MEQKPMRRPTKYGSLRKIIDLKIPIGTVIDVGILAQTWELRTLFPATKQLLIEPIAEYADTIRANYKDSAYELIQVAASDRDGEMQISVTSEVPGREITHARLTGTPGAGTASRTIQVRKLDTIVAERPDLAQPFLIKIDVDGAEILILEGSRGILPQVSVVVIEANIWNFVERARWLDAAGFQLFDFVDINYYDGRLRWFDLVFLNRTVIDGLRLDMSKQPFDMSKIVALA